MEIRSQESGGQKKNAGLAPVHSRLLPNPRSVRYDGALDHAARCD
jgi:hypothetical protein